MAERLGMAREVAWTKHHSGAPVLDPEREAAAELAPAAENLLASEGFSPAVIALAVAPLRR
jgi:chorismate mutase